jgi:hypothetical protein
VRKRYLSTAETQMDLREEKLELIVCYIYPSPSIRMNDAVTMPVKAN